MSTAKDFSQNLCAELSAKLNVDASGNMTGNISDKLAMDLKIQQLKRELAAQMPGAFCNAENLKKPQGFPTGFAPLDSFLEGGGLPQGSLSLLSGALGMGATSLWIESAAFALKEKKWVAWVSRDVPLMPVSLQQKGMNLGHFVAVESPLKKFETEITPGADASGSASENTSGEQFNEGLSRSTDASSEEIASESLDESQLDTRPDLNHFPGMQLDGSIPTLQTALGQSRPTKAGSTDPKQQSRSKEKLAWLLQELMSSGLFDLIGCDLGEEQLRVQDLRKLQAQARDANIALVFLTRRPPPKGASASLFSLILKFERRRILIERALHRPTPQSLPRSVSYDRFTLHTSDRIGTRSIPEANLKEREPHSLSQTS